MAAKKKTQDDKHVVLSQEAIDKLLKPALAPSQPIMISPWDLLQLERSEHGVKIAESLFRVRKAEELARNFAAELAKIKSGEEVRKVTQDFQSAALAHDKLAADLATRYNFSWSTHSYNPETGEVLESAPES